MAVYIVTEKSVALRYFKVEANSAEEAYQMWENDQCSDCYDMNIEDRKSVV